MTMRERLLRVLDSDAFALDAILAELATPDSDMIEAATRRTQGPEDSLYGTIFTAMISSVKTGGGSEPE